MRFDSEPVAKVGIPDGTVVTFIVPKPGWYRMTVNLPPSIQPPFRGSVELLSKQDAAAYGCEALFATYGPGCYEFMWHIDGHPNARPILSEPTDAPFVAPSPKTPPLRKNPESKVLAAGLAYLRSLPDSHARKVHGSVYSVGEPDIDAVIGGHSVKLECKAPGKKPTQVQVAVMRQWDSAGALVGWFTSVEHIQQLLRHLGERKFSTNLNHPGCVCPTHKENIPHGSRRNPRR